MPQQPRIPLRGISSRNFEARALEVFRFQAINNPVYARYIELLGISPSRIASISGIPFLPIAFFRTHRVVTGTGADQKVFASSGTTGGNTSKHFVTDIGIYHSSLLDGFRHFYGDPSNYCILALLPSYIEREDSSLVYMVSRLIERSLSPQSGFFSRYTDELVETILSLEAKGQPTMLIGVTFALLEMAKSHRLSLKSTVVMETGGMKGRGPELTRFELHKILTDAFGVKAVHSEYGMTELLSQAYSTGQGRYHCPPWMAILTRDPLDPYSVLPVGKPGGINVVDLANINSCSFIQTDDLGVIHPDGTFEVLGRLDGSVMRGCNLLALD